MYIKEAFKKLFTGDDVFSRHLTLFSICGLVGLYDAFISVNGLENTEMYGQIGYALVLILYSMFFLGYETLFLHERNLPDINLNSFKIVFCKPLFLVFLASVLLVLAKFSPEHLTLAFILELLLAVPLTAIQAGYSYNFNNENVITFLKSFRFNDYISLLIKRVLLFICAYIFVSIVIFLIFFVAGFVIALIYQGDSAEISMFISSLQTVVVKLSNFISGILFVYILSIICLVWDYELIKMKERKNENI